MSTCQNTVSEKIMQAQAFRKTWKLEEFFPSPLHLTFNYKMMELGLSGSFILSNCWWTLLDLTARANFPILPLKCLPRPGEKLLQILDPNFKTMNMTRTLDPTGVISYLLPHNLYKEE